MSNMMGNVASGMASGVGFGVAQRAVDAVMGPRSVEVMHSNAPVTAAPAPAVQQPAQQNSCASYQEELNQVCLLDMIDPMSNWTPLTRPVSLDMPLVALWFVLLLGLENITLVAGNV